MNKKICEMQRHLPKIEIERLQCLADIKKQYAFGTISLEEAKRQLKEKVGKPENKTSSIRYLRRKDLTVPPSPCGPLTT